MDGSRFDALARQLGSRRAALGGILAGLLLPLAAAARDTSKQRQRKGKNKPHTRKGKAQKQAQAQVEPCWRVGACIPKKGANVSRCDLAGYTPATPPDCTGCNLSRANLQGANLSGANLTKANLSGACLVDATLSRATIATTTNLYNAIFCRTIMPDGSTNTSGCEAGTACCPTCTSSAQCEPGQVCKDGSCGICVPRTCGNDCGPIEDGCGNTLQCVTCPTCPPGFEQAHGGCFQICNLMNPSCPSGNCRCTGNIAANFVCASFQDIPCTSSEDCPVGSACRTNPLEKFCHAPCSP